MSLNIACAQLNQRVGDMSGNADRIIDAARRAAEQGAAVLLTPELSLTGCPPGDALRREAFQQQVDAALDRIRQASASLPALTWVVGYPALEDGHRYNVLGAFRAGQQVARHRCPLFRTGGRRYRTRDRRGALRADDWGRGVRCPGLCTGPGGGR